MINYNANSLKGALRAAETLRKITAVNIANSETLGYKALEGVFAPDCECFDDLLTNLHPSIGLGDSNLHLEIIRSNKEGKKKKINGQVLEGSNVDTSKEISNLVSAASMTRSILATIQLNHKLQLDALNTLRAA